MKTLFTNIYTTIAVVMVALVGATPIHAMRSRNLCRAAYYGELETVKNMVAQGIPADCSDMDSWTPLEHAAHGNDEERALPVMQFLLVGHPVSATAKEHALKVAVGRVHYKKCELLLAYGANPFVEGWVYGDPTLLAEIKIRQKEYAAILRVLPSPEVKQLYLNAKKIKLDLTIAYMQAHIDEHPAVSTQETSRGVTTCASELALFLPTYKLFFDKN